MRWRYAGRYEWGWSVWLAFASGNECDIELHQRQLCVWLLFSEMWTVLFYVSPFWFSQTVLWMTFFHLRLFVSYRLFSTDERVVILIPIVTLWSSEALKCRQAVTDAVQKPICATMRLKGNQFWTVQQQQKLHVRFSRPPPPPVPPWLCQHGHVHNAWPAGPLL